MSRLRGERSCGEATKSPGATVSGHEGPLGLGPIGTHLLPVEITDPSKAHLIRSNKALKLILAQLSSHTQGLQSVYTIGSLEE